MMNKKLSPVLIGALVLLGVMSLPSYGQSRTQFVCKLGNDRVPTTFAITPRGDIPVIKWVSTVFPAPWSPMNRCQEVSQRFQNFMVQGKLKTLISGRVNSQPVVCAGDYCNSGNVLFTLKPGQSASRTLRALLAVQAGASAPLYEGSSEPETMVDMQEYLNSAPVEPPNNVAPVSNPQTNPNPTTSSPSDSQPVSPGAIW